MAKDKPKQESKITIAAVEWNRHTCYNLWIHNGKQTPKKMTKYQTPVVIFGGFWRNNLLFWKLLNKGKWSSIDLSFTDPTLPEDYQIVDEGEFFREEC